MATVANNVKVAALYSAVFNRAPDQEGLDFWVAQLDSGASLVDAAVGFTLHPVFTETYGEMTNIQFVNALYVNVLGAGGDAKGIQYWVDRLAAGESRGEIVASFVQGALEIDLDALLATGELSQADYDVAVLRQQTLTNKAEVGVYFAETFGAASNLSADTDTTTAEGLAADPAYVASQAAIAKVTADALSVTAAQSRIDAAATADDPSAALIAANEAAPVIDTLALTAALATLAAANEAVDAYIAAYGVDVDDDADVDADDITAALTAADAAFDANAFSTLNYDVAATDAQKAAVIQVARDNAAAAEQAALTAVQVAQADVDSAIATAAEIAAYEAADAAATAASSAYAAAADDLSDAILVFEAGAKVGFDATEATGLDLSDWTGVTYNDDNDDGTTPEVDLIVLSSTAGVFEVEESIVTAGTANGASATDVALLEEAVNVLNAYQAAYDALKASIEADNELAAAEAALGAELGDVQTLLTKQADYETAQAATVILEGLIADLAAAEADLAGLVALQNDVDAAKLAIAEAGYDLNAAGYDFTDPAMTDLDAGADADETEVYTVDGLGGAVTLGEGDLIVVSGYTYNNGDLETDGNNSVLEFFITENAGVFSIVFENSVFGSNTVGQAETTSVTLTGVTSLEDLTIGANYIMLA